MTTATDEVREALAMMTPFAPHKWEASERGDYTDDGIVILGDDRRIAVVNLEDDAAGIVTLRNRTAAALDELTARAERAEAALRRIGDSDYPRPVGKVYRRDGIASKHDQCVHGVWMYDDCGQCAEAFAREALEASHD